MDMLMGLCVGIGLSAACGFRIFVPLSVMSIAGMSGHLTLAPEFAWIASPVTLAAFLTATVLEVGAYYIPAVDNLLDTAAAPVAVVAGTVMTAACISDMSPVLTWSLAVIAGGGTAGLVQGMTTVTRLASTVSGGLANPVVSTSEAGGATLLAVLAIILPVLAAVLVLLILFYSLRAIYRWLRNRGRKPDDLSGEDTVEMIETNETPAA
jgi:hypothetical protein